MNSLAASSICHEAGEECKINMTLQGQKREVLIIYDEVSGPGIAIGENGKLIVTAPCTMSEQEVQQKLQEHEDAISLMLARAADKENRRPFSDRQMKQMIRSRKINLFGSLYPLRLDEGMDQVVFDGRTYTVYSSNLDDLPAVLEMIREDLTGRLKTLFEQEQTRLFHKMDDWPEQAPHLELVEGLGGPASVDLESFVIYLNPDLVQMNTDYLEYLAADTLCTLIDQGDSEQHAKLMDDLMPDWRDRIDG